MRRSRSEIAAVCLIALALALVALAALLIPRASAEQPPAPMSVAVAQPDSHTDPAEGNTPLDLVGARFGQSGGNDLTLAVRTHKPWQPSDIHPPRRMICVWLRNDRAQAQTGRLCVVPNTNVKSGLSLRYSVLDLAGNRVGIRNLSRGVRRPRPTVFSATFAPAALRLQPGNYHWHVRSLSNDVEDQLPNRGEVPLTIARPLAPAARERCFGAASRDPLRRCVNTKLRQTVVPTPDDAALSLNSPCTPLAADGQMSPCEFGLPEADAKATVALLGDSHASHWRAALEVVAQRKGWRGVSITRSGCPVSRATPTLDPPSRAMGCMTWNQQLPLWFAKHPNVETVFVVGHFAEKVVPAEGTDQLSAKIAGFTAAWEALPKTVKRIVVIRDTPLMGYDPFECVRRAHKRRGDAGRACAVSRKGVLRSDAAVVAARRVDSPRVRTIDMTRFLCSTRKCFPVVGGALVYKDDQHLVDVFATTLGPYLLRAIDKL